MIVADKDHSFLISGTGDVVKMDDDILATGSGGNYALSAARALVRNTDLSAEEIVKKSLEIAGEICVFTNQNHIIETIDANAPEPDEKKALPKSDTQQGAAWSAD